MYTSLIEVLATLNTWRRDRFSHALFIPVALTLVVASLIGSEWPGFAFALRGLAAWLTVLALRLWDDLEDLQRDKAQHAERVLTQVASAGPYFLTVIGLLLIAGPLSLLAGGAAWGWLALLSALMIFYRLKGQTLPGGDFAILLKYPLLVLALGGSWQPTGLAALGLVLAAVCLDEILQRPSPKRYTVVVGTSVLVGAACLLLVQTRQAPLNILVIQSALILGISSLSIQSLFGNPRRKLTRGGLLTMTFIILMLCKSAKFSEFFHAN